MATARTKTANKPAAKSAATPAAKPRSRAAPRAEASRLSRDDWLDAAFDAAVHGGFGQVRVLAIAERLGVTRGSFYWHFGDHAALLAALLERWRARQAEADRAVQAQVTDDPRADLLRLLDAALARGGPDHREMRFELALRDFARRDAAAARLLAQVDDARRSLIESKYLRLTGDPAVSGELAVLFYLSIAGAHQALGRVPNSARVAERVRSVIAEHLIERQVPTARATPRRASGAAKARR